MWRKLRFWIQWIHASSKQYFDTMELCRHHFCTQPVPCHLQINQEQIKTKGIRKTYLLLKYVQHRSNCRIFLPTFCAVWNRTASCLAGICIWLLLVIVSCTHSFCIDFKVKEGSIPVCYGKIDREVIEPISTRGHCECSGCTVVSVNNKQRSNKIHLHQGALWMFLLCCCICKQ